MRVIAIEQRFPRPSVMGVVNVTPDSFFDGGVRLRPEDAIASARRMVDEGAAIVDVGGESTRPGSEGVSADEELRRVLPVLEGLAGLPVSIDTSKAEVARRALALGAELVNDVSALRGDVEFRGLTFAYDGTPVLHRVDLQVPAGSTVIRKGDAGDRFYVVEDGLVSKVERGENAGRTLAHTAVVRALQRVGTVAAGAAQWSAEVPVPSNDSWKEPRVVAFVQDVRTRRVLAAGALKKEGDGGAAERDERAADDQAHGAKDAHVR